MAITKKVCNWVLTQLHSVYSSYNILQNPAQHPCELTDQGTAAFGYLRVIIVWKMVGTRSLSNSGNDDLLECKECSIMLGSQDYKIDCEYCSNWFHYTCVGFNDSLLAAFNKLRAASLASFYCPSCKVKLEQLKNSLGNSESGNSPVQESSRLELVERKIDKLTESLERLIGTESSSTVESSVVAPAGRSSYASAVSRGITPSAPVITIGDLQKVQEEESHRRSLVIAGLPESGNDLADVSELIKYLDPSATVSEVFRMGRCANQSNGATRPRLLKAHLPSSSVVRSILSQAKRLAVSATFKGVYVRRSMTLEERERLAKVRSHCRELNDNEHQEGVKYAIISEHLVKFSGCHRDEGGRLVGGVRDRDWLPEGSTPAKN